MSGDFEKLGVVGVVGLGYVGLPLALAFGKKIPTIGFDINQSKIDAYLSGTDPTGEMPKTAFQDARGIQFTTQAERLRSCDSIIIAVPTPVDEAKRPEIRGVVAACEAVGRSLKKGAVVILESTVYPGFTEEVCAPALAKASQMKLGEGFFVGYSPERINPGDQEHRLETITKVVSGYDAATLDRVAGLYEAIITVGVHRASSIRVAEAAKVIENTQRDLNIALMNELAVIFDRMKIDTTEVLEAARTKWNFLPFKPGLVGGHCIGVDPYYLTHKAQMLGYIPEVILAGRKINDGMGKFIAEKTVKKMIEADFPIKNAEVLVLGITFKENCSDIRNSKVVDVIDELKAYGCRVSVYDPVANAAEVEHEYGLPLISAGDVERADSRFHAIVGAVAHQSLVSQPSAVWKKAAFPRAPFMDVKAAFSRRELESLGFQVWRL